MRRALVLGGSGTVGAEVVRRLAAADVETSFTFHSSGERAKGLAEETGARALQVDLRDAAALRAACAALDPAPDVLIHCAALTRAGAFVEAGDDVWDDVLGVNLRAPAVACQALASAMQAREGGGDVVLVGALGRGQDLPIPVAFAASMGGLGALGMALAKELGPAVRVNTIALGVLEGGLSESLSAATLSDFESFSALQRKGTPQEAAEAIAWLALENTYMSGETVPVNGGI